MSAQPEATEQPAPQQICCLLAVELESYQERPVFEQIRLTQAFTRLLAESIPRAPAHGLVRIEREDNALISFGGEAQECFAAALRMRSAAAERDDFSAITLKIGINLGPVRIAKNAFGYPELSGEGLRDVELALRDAEPGEVTLSRTFFHVLARTAPGYATQIRYKGLLATGDSIPLDLYHVAPLARIDIPPAANAAPNGQIEPGGTLPNAEHAPPLSARPPMPAPHRRLKPLQYASAALVVLTTAVAVYKAGEETPGSAPTIAAYSPTEPLRTRPKIKASAPAPAATTLAQPAVEQPKPPELANEPFKPAAAEGAPDSQPAEPVSAVDEPAPPPPAAGDPPPPPLAASEPTAPIEATSIVDGVQPSPLTPSATPAVSEPQVPPPSKASRAAEKPRKAAPKKKPATVYLAVKPWGEVYVDGKKKGVSPPLKSLKVEPGRRSIVVKNGKHPSYKRTVKVTPDAKVTLAHVFGQTRTR